MTDYCVCPECAFCLGDISEFFELAKQAYIEMKKTETKEKEKEKKSGETVSTEFKLKNYTKGQLLMENNTITFQELFDILEINNRCCRMHLVSKTNYKTAYNVNSN